MRQRFAARLHGLSVRQVQTANDGDHGDGGGLILRVRGASAVWVFRFTAPCGRRREMGLGICERQNATLAGNSLVRAREQAQEARAKLSQGTDPIDARDADRKARREALQAAAQPKGKTLSLARACRTYYEQAIEGNRSPKHEQQWIGSLEVSFRDHPLWNKAIADITAPELLDFLVVLQKRVPETARRVHQRLTAVFDDCQFRGVRPDNPAASIRMRLSKARVKRKVDGFKGLEYKEVPAFVERLRQIPGVAPRCLEFLLLTAARTSEAIEAEWCEVDLEQRLWVVPAARMKGGDEHAVYLSDRAVEILEGQKGLHKRWVFPSSAGEDEPLSNGGMLQLLRRMKINKKTTVHGLRASFSSWGNECFGAKPDVVEACLAHRERDRVRAAYNRAVFSSERRQLLAAWSSFCDGKEVAAKVVELLAA